MTDKMEKLLIKINRARINYVTMVSPNNKPDMVKILNPIDMKDFLEIFQNILTLA